MVNRFSPAKSDENVKPVSRLSGVKFPESAQEKLDEIGRPPINLHKALGHTPEMLGPLLDLIHAARFDAHTPRHERELIIVRIGQLEQSDYELAHHVPMALDAGLTQDQLDELDQWRSSDQFDDRAKAILELADSIGLADELNVQFVDKNLSAAEQAELAMVGSTYILIARVARTFDIEIDEHLRSLNRLNVSTLAARILVMDDRFDVLVTEAEAAPVEGWDFSWLEGRATEERPSWGYARKMAERLKGSQVALDIQTGGGEVLNEAPLLPPKMVVTEAWPPNIAKAKELLAPRNVEVIAHDGREPMPFSDNTFDLITCRHPVGTQWNEIRRVMRPGGTYFSQEVGAASVFELTEYFLGPQPESVKNSRGPEVGKAGAEAAGLQVIDLRNERLEMRFYDIGAVIYFLRKVIWIVPGFDVEIFRDRLRDLHQLITREGYFAAESSRYLIEARLP